MSIAELLLESAQVLRNAGVPEARREAGSLLAHVLDRDRTFIISHAEDHVADEPLARFRALIQRRAAGEPTQYLVGHQEFFGLEFVVSPAVLIPRPETELLVEKAIELARDTEPLICDIGTGSGCVAVSLLCNLAGGQAKALDISVEALQIAKLNAQKHGVGDRIEFIRSDGFDGIEKEAVFDLVVSNPPYITEQAFPGLQREVRDYEPRTALSPGGDGLALIRRLIAEGHLVLKTNGHLLIEIGFDQRDAVMELIDQKVWRLLDFYRDLQGIPRTVVLQKR